MNDDRSADDGLADDDGPTGNGLADDALADDALRARLRTLVPPLDVDSAWHRLAALTASDRGADQPALRLAAPTPRHPAPARATSGSRPTWVLAAAAAIVVLIGLVVVQPGRERATDVIGSTTATDPPATARPADPEPDARRKPPRRLSPTWMPDGLHLWRAAWAPEPVASPDLDPGSTTSAYAAQLFRPPGTSDGGVLVAVDAGSTFTGSNSPVTVVRGVNGWRSPGVPGSAFGLQWNETRGDEHGAVSVSVAGVAEADAKAFVERMTWRRDGLWAGVDPASVGPWLLVGETGPTSIRPSGKLVLDYDDAGRSGWARHLSVETMVHDPDPRALLTARLGGRPRGDDAFEVFDPAGQTYRVVWTDGRSVTLTGLPSTSLTDDRRIVDSLRARGGDDLVALRRDASAMLMTRPLLATLPLPEVPGAGATVGHVDIRGEAASRTACLVLDGAPPACTQSDQGAGTTPFLADGFMMGSTWWALAVSNRPEIRLLPGDLQTGVSRAAGRPLDGPRVPSGAVDGDGWHGVLAAVPADLDLVTAFFLTSPSGGSPMTLGRPGVT